MSKRQRAERHVQCPHGDCTYAFPSAAHLRKHEEEDSRAAAAARASKVATQVAAKTQLEAARASTGIPSDLDEAVWFDAIAPPPAVLLVHDPPTVSFQLHAAQQADYNDRLLQQGVHLPPVFTSTASTLASALAALQQHSSALNVRSASARESCSRNPLALNRRFIGNHECRRLSRHAKTPFYNGSGVTLRSTPVFSMAKKTAQEKQSLMQNIVLYGPDLFMTSLAGQVND